jgi:hypothetical protein
MGASTRTQQQTKRKEDGVHHVRDGKFENRICSARKADSSKSELSKWKIVVNIQESDGLANVELETSKKRIFLMNFSFASGQQIDEKDCRPLEGIGTQRRV